VAKEQLKKKEFESVEFLGKLKALEDLFSHGNDDLSFTNLGSYGVSYILRDLAKDLEEFFESKGIG